MVDAPNTRESKLAATTHARLDCCYCAELAGHESEFHRLYPSVPTRVVVATENFVAVPSLGQLARGHMLLLPRWHVTSFGALDRHQRHEAGVLYSQLRHALSRRYSSVVCFEHGSPHGADSGGCGIVHAHVHMVPIGDLGQALPPSASNAWCVSNGPTWLDDAARHASNSDGYLMWHAPRQRPHFERANQVPSQFLRRHVAAMLGSETWDWRTAGVQDDFVATLRDQRDADLAAVIAA